MTFQSASGLNSLLDAWQANGWLRPLDCAFARFLHQQAPESPQDALLLAALASQHLSHGHVCLDLAAALHEPAMIQSNPLSPALTSCLQPVQLLTSRTLEDWSICLLESPAVAIAQALSQNSPLVLENHRLYLRRYWGYERQLADHIVQRLSSTLVVPTDLPRRLDVLFPPPATGLPDWQRIACTLAMRHPFTLITGGPGTGKTTTVVRLLALLQSSAIEQGAPLRICLAAPTGKAAARLTASIRQQIQRLPVDPAVRNQIPQQVITLHRLLGGRPDTRRFRYHAANPLPLDALIIDEASMIDLELFALLSQAMPRNARLILLGDKDQLASVEAGAILGDLCRDADIQGYDSATRTWLQAMGASTGLPLDEGPYRGNALLQQTATLQYSHRFDADSGIGRLAQYINEGDAIRARQLVRSDLPDISLLPVSGINDPVLTRFILQGIDGSSGYAAYLHDMNCNRPAADADENLWQAWARKILENFSAFQILCAVQQGPWGVDAVNDHIAAILTRNGLLNADVPWYPGRPVLITRNDYNLNLMNGDIGITLCLPASDNAENQVLRVAFTHPDHPEQVRLIPPSRLGNAHTVFAMTVHKSQGSEFRHCALLMPDTPSPVLCRELIYTATTRSREHFTLLETAPHITDSAIERRIRRISGLMEKIMQTQAINLP